MEQNSLFTSLYIYNLIFLKKDMAVQVKIFKFHVICVIYSDVILILEGEDIKSKTKKSYFWG
ncbi:MAG: hypothetical protein DRP89_01845 [Candidatus Neomarinimicrobiota bacterium]|nr:MAG: hypothetical protein DRP89_01845 [Candidatus Neomarinimicrobiota bacterium]